MAALDVFKAISGQVDSDFLAMDVLPIIWQFSLGPLLNLPQFQAYMALIKTMSARVENEQTRKLQELGANNATATTRNEFMSFGGPSVSNGFDASNGNAGDADFEALVRGGPGTSENPDMLGGDPWANAPASASSSTVLPSRPSVNRARSTNNSSPAATFSWSSPPVSTPPMSNTNLSAPKPQSRAITPDNTLSSLNSSFPALSATNPGIGSPSFAPPQQQPGSTMGTSSMMSPSTPSYTNTQGSGVDWSKVGGSTMASNPWGNTPSMTSMSSNLSNFSALAPTPSSTQPQNQSNPFSSFSIAPPPLKPAGSSTFSIAPPPSMNMANRAPASSSGMGLGMNMNMNSMAALRAQNQQQNQQPSQKQPDWGSGGDSLI